MKATDPLIPDPLVSDSLIPDSKENQNRSIPSLIQLAHDKGRISTLGDGVFAIIMTLQVLDLKIPTLIGRESLSLVLLHMWPHFAIYFITFLFLGIYWQGWRAEFVFISASNYTLNWMSLIFFCTVSLLPFSEDLLAQYPHHLTAIFIFVFNTWLIGGMLAIIFYYIDHHQKPLQARGINSNLRHVVYLRCLVLPIGGIVGGILYILTKSTVLMFVVFALVPILYMIPKFWNVLDKIINLVIFRKIKTL